MVDRPARVVARLYGQAGPFQPTLPQICMANLQDLKSPGAPIASHGEAVRPVGRASLRRQNAAIQPGKALVPGCEHPGIARCNQEAVTTARAAFRALPHQMS